MAKIKVTYGRKVPVGKSPEVYFEASMEDDVPAGSSAKEHFAKCWEAAEEQVEARIEAHVAKSRPRCERCGKVVESLFSTWDAEKKEYLQLCFEDYTVVEQKKESMLGESI
jgi:hypothetical protein